MKRRKEPLNSFYNRRCKRSKDWVRSWFFTSDGKFTNFERLNPEE